MGLQSRAWLRGAIDLILPNQCAACSELVEGGGVLCGPCWRQTPFISGLVCDGCGVPLPGADDSRVLCDDCLSWPPAWSRGRAAMMYRDTGKRLVLALKHGDRLDLVGPASDWMVRAARPLLAPGMIVVPVPVHRWRLIRRRYNQAALLAHGIGIRADLACLADALRRERPTGTQDGKSRQERHENLEGVFAVAPKRRDQIAGRHILLADDVMTSGATLSGCTEALLAAGAAEVSTVVLARVARDT